MDWARDLPSWSHASYSRRVDLHPTRWHVQEMGEGPLILLIPGVGASVHTWRDMLPALAEHYHVVAIDLPGQGFSEGPVMRMGLDLMSEDLARLIAAEGWTPSAFIGHSAGAAIALRLAPTHGSARVVGINPALEDFAGAAEWLFPLMAKTLALNPFTANLFTMTMTQASVRQLLRGTGSNLPPESVAFYVRLLQNRSHVNGALQMMAQWSLAKFARDLPSTEVETLFLTGAKDKAVPPSVAERAAEIMPNANVERYGTLGHIAHEEAPVELTERILEFLADAL